MKDKVLYIYTHSEGWQGHNKRTDSFPQLQLYHFWFTGDGGSAPASQIQLQLWEQVSSLDGM